MAKIQVEIKVDGVTVETVERQITVKAQNPQPPPQPKLVASNHAELMQRLEQAEPGDIIWLSEGWYYGPLNVDKSHITIQALPDAQVHFSALVPIAGNWTQDGSVWSLPFSGIAGLPKHPADAAGASRQWHRRAMSPYQLVFDPSPSDALVHLEVFARDRMAPGTFFVQGGYGSESAIHWLPFEASMTPEHLKIARYPHLLSGTGENVKIKGIHFHYGANTAKYGTVFLNKGKNWHLEDVHVWHAGAVGFEIRTDGNTFIDCGSHHAGQMGWHMYGSENGVYQDCKNNYSNVSPIDPDMPVFDARWEGGMKLDHGCHGNKFYNWSGVGNNGSTWWCDINNNNLLVDGLKSSGDMGCGMQVELTCHNSRFQNIEIEHVRPWRFMTPDGVLDMGRNPLSAGLIIQANVQRCTFDTIRVDSVGTNHDGYPGLHHAGMYYKKQERNHNRGLSGDNTFREIIITNCGRNWYIEGSEQTMPDQYVGRTSRG